MTHGLKILLFRTSFRKVLENPHKVLKRKRYTALLRKNLVTNMTGITPYHVIKYRYLIGYHGNTCHETHIYLDKWGSCGREYKKIRTLRFTIGYCLSFLSGRNIWLAIRSSFPGVIINRDIKGRRNYISYMIKRFDYLKKYVTFGQILASYWLQ